ncbi:MAG: response regulator [Deltaproteobacteria bacterium]|nr:response regulator [Deltaproteobacteria bacterium]
MEPFTVVFVDDEADYVESLIKRMRRRNIQAYGAGSGEAALTLLADKHREIDVIVLDVRMPGMDGLAVLKEVKKRHPLIEVIMLSGHANLAVAKEGMEMGAFDYLMKPVDLDELLYKLQDAHQKKSLQESKIAGLERAKTMP